MCKRLSAFSSVSIVGAEGGFITTTSSKIQEVVQKKLKVSMSQMELKM